MPNLNNTSLIGLILATLAFYMVGFLWYGILFDAPWMEMAGMTEAEALARNTELGAMMFVYGLLITLAQVIGLNWLIDKAGAYGVQSCIAVALMVATFIALPVMLYAWLYEGDSFRGDILDLGHLSVGYGLAALVLSVFRKT